MQVDPTRLVELAATSERVLTEMAHDWQAAVDELGEACAGVGDATGTLDVATSYADSLADADAVVTALVTALGVGAAGLLDAAHDVVGADDTVAGELGRTAHQVEGEAFGAPPGRGGG